MLRAPEAVLGHTQQPVGWAVDHMINHGSRVVLGIYYIKSLGTQSFGLYIEYTVLRVHVHT